MISKGKKNFYYIAMTSSKQVFYEQLELQIQLFFGVDMKTDGVSTEINVLVHVHPFELHGTKV